MAISMPKEQSVNFSISEEGLKALRERVNELQPKIEYTDPREMKRVETNEIEDAHKDGDRLVSYEIMGDKILTLEEDL